MIDKPNWDLVNKCGAWKVLGVSECDNCPQEVKCWGTDSQLPYLELTPEQQAHWEQTLKEIFHVGGSHDTEQEEKMNKSLHVVWVGKAKDVFDEIKKTALWSKYGIGYKVYCMTVLNLNQEV